MTKNIMKQMYMQYVSAMNKIRKEHVDIPTEQISKKKSKKK